MSDEVLDFEKIHAEFRPKILRYLTHMVGEYDAEDLTQEVFIKISQALDTFRGESRISTWIYRIATNTALNRLRSPAFQRAAPDGLAAGPGLDELVVGDQDVWTGEESPSIEQQLHHIERFACYCAFIEKLPENYRVIVALNSLEEFTIQEIAEILGLNPGVVKVRLHRGRDRLLQELKAHCRPEDWL